MSSNWIASRGSKPRSQSEISVHTSSPAWPSGASRDGGVSGRSMKATRSVGHGNCTGSRKDYQKQHSEVAREHGKPRVRQRESGMRSGDFTHKHRNTQMLAGGLTRQMSALAIVLGASVRQETRTQKHRMLAVLVPQGIHTLVQV